jgi:hypothetical protein
MGLFFRKFNADFEYVLFFIKGPKDIEFGSYCCFSFEVQLEKLILKNDPAE